MRPETRNPRHRPAPAITEADVDSALEEFGGNPRATILALLQDLDALARDYEGSVSHGYVRGDIPRLALPGRARKAVG